MVFGNLKEIVIFKDMNSETEHFFLKGLTTVKRASTKYGPAPHKPILLLTFLEMVDEGLISENRVTVSADLVGLFQENWRILVDTPHQADFTQPFFYLQNDNIKGTHFWYLIPKPAKSIHGHIKSINSLIEHLDYGHFDEGLYKLMQEKGCNQLLRRALLEKYFPKMIDAYMFNKKFGNEYLIDWENFILKKSSDPTKTIRVSKEEEIFIRQAFFKKYIPQIYKDTCCISGMRLIPVHGYSMIDACHIVPFGVGQNDHVSNGIALCPNLHRAFDRGLITIGEDYRVLVSSLISENSLHPYSLGILKDRKVLLPVNPLYFPDRENLNWHRSNIFKG